MRNDELYVCVKDPMDHDLMNRLNGVFYDVSIGTAAPHVGFPLTISFHSRKTGYTSVIPAKRCWISREQASGIGGHCHWTQLNVELSDDRVIVITPNIPGKEFEEWCDIAVAA